MARFLPGLVLRILLFFRPLISRKLTLFLLHEWFLLLVYGSVEIFAVLDVLEDLDDSVDVCVRV